MSEVLSSGDFAIAVTHTAPGTLIRLDYVHLYGWTCLGGGESSCDAS